MLQVILLLVLIVHMIIRSTLYIDVGSTNIMQKYLLCYMNVRIVNIV